MPYSIPGQEAFYRRGLVLGLTMAEIVLLVIFCLLLAMAFLLKKEKEAREELVQRVAALQEENESMRQALGSDVNRFDDIFRELQLARKKASTADALSERVEALEKEQQKLVEVQKLTAEAGLKDKDLIETVRKLIAQADELKALKAVAGDEKELKEVVEENAQLARENRTLQGQLQNIRQKLVALGKGTEMPACWATPDTGRTEYIFDVGLTSAGLILHDRALPHRAEEQRKLPVRHITFDRELDPATFRAQTRALFEWSVDHECRFFVRVFDLTGPTEKETYKRHMRVLEEHFYKLEVLQEPDPWGRKYDQRMKATGST